MNATPPNSPLTIAKESMQMSKESGDRTFRIVALVMMAATGVATLLQAGHILWRDLRDERGHRRGNGRTYSPEDLPEHVASNRAKVSSRHEESAPERTWSGKPGLARRTPEAGQQRTAYTDTAAQGRQR
jgi:phytoene/squalene synthetase